MPGLLQTFVFDTPTFCNSELFSLSKSTAFVNENLCFSVMDLKGLLSNSKSPELDWKYSAVCLLRQKPTGLSACPHQAVMMGEIVE